MKQEQSGTPVYFYYDPAGHRLGTYTLWSYGGQLYPQMVAGQQQIYFAGRNVSQIQDRLGSMVGGANGVTSQYYPYGEEYTATTQDTDKFATYYRDQTTALDYARNRYYSSTWGRFLTPDPFAASVTLGNPQSWNRYAYVGNDPVNHGDPLGLDDSGGSEGPPTTVDLSALCLAMAQSAYQSSSNPFSGLWQQHNWGSAGYYEWQMACLGIMNWSTTGGVGGGDFGTVDVNKSYNIDVRCKKSATGVVADIGKNFASFANYTGSWNGLTTTLGFNVPTGGIQTGTVIQIPHTTLGITVTDSVTVTQSDSTSFTLSTNPGHPLTATISFNAQDMGSGFVGFSISINGQTANAFWSLFFEGGGGSFENGVWNHFLDQVTADCKTQSAPGH